MFVSGVEKEKLLWRYEFPLLRNGCLITFKICVHKTEKNLKLLIRSFNSTLFIFFQKSISEASENVNLFVSLLCLVSFGFCIYIQYFFDVVRNKLQTKILIERRSKVQENNMSCERALNFDQWKTFSENYKPIRVWLWLVY